MKRHFSRMLAITLTIGALLASTAAGYNEYRARVSIRIVSATLNPDGTYEVVARGRGTANLLGRYVAEFRYNYNPRIQFAWGTEVITSPRGDQLLLTFDSVELEPGIYYG